MRNADADADADANAYGNSNRLPRQPQRPQLLRRLRLRQHLQQVQHLTQPQLLQFRLPNANRHVNNTPTVTPTPTPTTSGCVLGAGYWKNHEQWPLNQLQLGNRTYNRQELQSILRQPGRANGLVFLARQEIAAKLNIANGADGSCVEQTLTAADAAIGNLVIPPVGNGYLRFTRYVRTLGLYNNGDLCAPIAICLRHHCRVHALLHGRGQHQLPDAGIDFYPPKPTN